MENVENPFQLHDDADGNELHAFVDHSQISPYSEPPPGETPEQKYRRLQAREAELLRRQQEIRETEGAVSHRPNWPKYVSFLYVNLESDIPQSARRCIKIALVGVVLVLCQSVINIVAASSIFGLPSYSRVKSIIFSIVFALITCYVTISICWDKLYNGCKLHDLPFSYIVWQFVLIGWSAYLAIGFPNSGSVGVATFIDLIAKSKNAWSMVIAGINTALVVASFVVHIIVLQQAQRYQRVSGVPEIMQPMVPSDVSSV